VIVKQCLNKYTEPQTPSSLPKEVILNNVNALITNKDKYQKMSKAHNPYGDGKANERIVTKLL